MNTSRSNINYNYLFRNVKLTGKLEIPYRMDVSKNGCSTEIWTEGCVSAGGVTGDGFTSMILGK